jgi:hypothetical protein
MYVTETTVGARSSASAYNNLQILLHDVFAVTVAISQTLSGAQKL